MQALKLFGLQTNNKGNLSANDKHLVLFLGANENFFPYALQPLQIQRFKPPPILGCSKVKCAVAQKTDGVYFQLESKRPVATVNFQTLQARLLAEVNTRIDNGYFSERALGRLTGISQPHLHNLLKGARKLSPQLADILLDQLGISVLYLLTADELTAIPRKPAGSVRVVPSALELAR